MRQFLYAVDRDDVLRSVSPEWLEFAQENDAPELKADVVLGRPLWEFISGGETRHLYGHLFEKARWGAPVSVRFRCDSPSVRRFMRLTIHPVHRDGLEIVSEVLREEEREPVALLDAHVPRSSEMIEMCSWCRRVSTGPDQWEEVEAAIEALGLFEDSELPAITHSACRECHDRMIATKGLDESP